MERQTQINLSAESGSASGRLFFVMGASGAGKDSVINAMRHRFNGRLVVAHRYITRPASAGCENHVALSEAEFDLRLEREQFAMHWLANGLRYGIGLEVDNWLNAGMDVVVNGSRAYLPYARERYGNRLAVVWISVRPEILKQRLTKRGRETEREIAERLERAIHYDAMRPDDAIQLNNSGSLDDTVEQLSTHFDQLLAEPNTVSRAKGENTNASER